MLLGWLLPFAAMAQPNVNLGADTTICGINWVLDATTSNATYLWSTGATTPSIIANTSGVYWVDVTNGTGSTRDSIKLMLAPTPALSYLPNDTALCQGLQLLSLSATGGLVQWLDSALQQLATGDTLLYNFQDTTQLYYQANYFTPLPNQLGEALSRPPSGFAGLDRGIEFEVLETIQLNSIALDIDNGPFTAQLVIETLQGQVVYSQTVSLPAAGQHRVPINAVLPTGTFRIFLRNLVGGRGRFNNPISNWTIYNTPQIRFVSGSPFATVYAYFYEWEISTLGATCASPLDSILVYSLPTPVIHLPNDTLACADSLVLDVSGNGSTYTWSNSATTPSITVYSSGMYSVTVSQGGACPSSDTIQVDLQQAPIFTNRPSNGSTCQGTAQLVAQANTGIVQWLDSAQTVVAIGDTLTYDFQNTTQFYYRAGYWESMVGTVGRDFSSGNGLFTALGDRGVVFDVVDFMELNSVQIEIDNGPFTAEVVVLDNQGRALSTIPVSLSSAGVHTISLDVVLSPGTRYSLVMRNILGGNVYLETGMTPALWQSYRNASLQFVEGHTFASVYGYFYNWETSVLGDFCTTTLDSVRLDVLPTPMVNLGADTILCNTPIVLDAGANTGNTTYQWNTSASSQTLNVITSGVYSVLVMEGGLCTGTDTIQVDIVRPPNLTQTPVDQTLCRGNVDLVAQASTGTITWRDENGTLLSIGDTVIYTAIDSAILYFQSAYWERMTGTVGRDFSSGSGLFVALGDRGVVFDVVDFMELTSVQIEIDNGPFTADVVLRDNQGRTLYTAPVSFSSAGVHTIPLNVAMVPGTRYSLALRNISGGNVYLETGMTPALWQSYRNASLEFVEGYTFASVYGYFYNWQISTLSNFCASTVDSVRIDVLPTPTVELGNDTALCSGSLILDVTNPSGIYTWNNNRTTPTITVTATGDYSVTVSSNGLCPVVDSIFVEVLQRPVFMQRPSDIAACREAVTLTAQASSGIIQWLDSLGTVLSLGDTLVYDLTDTTRLYYQSGYFASANSHPGASFDLATGPDTLAFGRGIEFQANEYIRLDEVQIYIDQAPFTAEVSIQDQQNNQLYQASLSYSTPGIKTLNLGVAIPPNVPYVLFLDNISGGNVRLNSQITNWAQFSTPEVQFIGGAPFGSVYGYFYNWKISVLGGFCSSGQDSVLLDLLPTPIVDFPTDTIVCDDSLRLDVTQLNANYAWAPVGVTTGDLLITQEDHYRVTVSVGSCEVSDSIQVYLTPEPSPTFLSTDTTTCLGVIERRATGADVLKWYDAPVGGNLIGQGEVFNYFAQATDTLWLQGQNFVNKRYVQGQQDTLVEPNSDYFFPRSVRGLRFEAHDAVLLESVTMYIEQPALVGTIALWDSNDVVIDSQSIVLTNPGANVVPLGFNIPQGQGYKLVLSRYNTVRILSEFPFSSFPVRGDYVTIEAGYPFGSVYQYFYDWQIKTVGCAADRQRNIVTVLPTPSIDFPVDSVICGSNLLLDASGVGATSYQWSNGSTAVSVLVDSTQSLTLIGYRGICSDTGSINLFIVEPPSLIVPPNDTVVCQGNTIFRASGNAAYYAWYDSLNAATPFALGDSIRVNLMDSTTLWVEGIGFIPQSKPQGERYRSNLLNATWLDIQATIYKIRGMDFRVKTPILLNSVDVYTDTIMTANLVLLKSGFPYYNKSITLGQIGQNTVTIDTLLEPGVYRMVLSNVSEGELLIIFPYGNGRLQRLNTNEIDFIGSTPLLNQYSYFFDWRISTPSCATARLPVQVDVPPSPVLSMVADTATCTATSIVLDPVANNNPAYTYQWNTGLRSDTLMVNTSGYYAVTVTNDGRCASIQNTYVQFLTTPTAYVQPDIDLCTPQFIDLGTTSTDGLVVWYDSSDLNNVAHLTVPYRQYVEDTTTYWVDVAPKATTRLGTQAYPAPNEAGAYLSFILANTFDVAEYAILDSVALYVARPNTVVDWVIMDSTGTTLYSGLQTIGNAREKTFLRLNALLAPGRGYQLSFNSIGGPFLVDQTPPHRPTSSSGIAKLTGTVFSGVVYTCFFDWHFSYAFPSCHAVGDTFAVNIALPVALPDTVFACDTAVVSVAHGNANTYLWSTNETTPQITLRQAGRYQVTITDGGGCTLVDTVDFVLPLPVGLPTGSAICGNELVTNYDINTAQFTWNTGVSTPTILLSGPNIYSVTVTTNAGCVLVDSVYIAQLVPPPSPQLGGNRTVCFTHTLDAGFGGQGMTYEWNTGAITQQIAVTQSGLYTVTVTHPLGCSGTDAAFVTVDTLPTASFTITRSGQTISLTNTSTGASLGTTYFWRMGDGAQYRIPEPFHTYADTGCYTIQLIVTDVCGSDTTEQRIGVGRPDSSCTISVHRLPNLLPAQFKVAPNPNTGSFNLLLEQPLERTTQVYLYNGQGQRVYSRLLEDLGQQQWRIAPNQLPAGIYLLQVTDARQTSVQRIVVRQP